MADSKKTLGNPHKNHRERLKNRFLENGLDSFEKHNILELLLFYSVPRRDTNVLGHRLLERFSTISGVFDASFDELMEVEGIGENTATLIKLIPSLSREYFSELSAPGQKRPGYDELGQYFVSRFAGVSSERVIGVFLDNAGRIIGEVSFPEGSVSSAELSFRRVTEAALSHKAAFVVLAHNHPHGEAIPSFDDYDVTKRLKRHLEQIDITLLDHFIIAGRRYTSIDKNAFVRAFADN